MLGEFVTLIWIGGALRKVDILVAVEPAPLLRVIEHLLRRQPEFRIVAGPSAGSPLARQASHLRPDLIIVNMRLLGQGASTLIPAVKLASPGSKLIVTGFPQGFGRHAHQWGADAYLEEEDLVRRLVPTAQRLLSQPSPDQRKGTAQSRRMTSIDSTSARPSKGDHPC